MWKTKTFQTAALRDAWIRRQGHRYQWQEIIVNNAYGVLCRRLRRLG